MGPKDQTQISNTFKCDSEEFFVHTYLESKLIIFGENEIKGTFIRISSLI